MMNISNRLSESSTSQDIRDQKRNSWLQIISLSIFAIYFYVFMEWLFFITKPSFMDAMEAGKKIEVLFITALIITGFSILFVLALFILSQFPGLSKQWKLILQASGLLSAFFLSSTSLLMVDNFSYTLFTFGIVRSEGVIRGLYGLMFLVMFGLWYRWILHQVRIQNNLTLKERSFNAQMILCLIVLLISSFLAFTGLENQNQFIKADAGGKLVKRPHIILLGGDGINAMNMSVYGYDRDTTPNLRMLAAASLQAENAFTNSANSSGSVASILTGKLPTRTGVVYPPNILKDSNAYQHLPGILRSAGYYTAEIGAPYYVDAFELNIQEGFDLVNQRSVQQNQLIAQKINVPFQNVNYFFRILSERIISRLFHIFFIQEMQDPYRAIIGEVIGITDQERFDQLTNLLGKADQPLFVHVHMMTTHGAIFSSRQQVFSSGQVQDSEWMTDFYDDAILDFDAYVGELLVELFKTGLLNETILIIYSDHNQNYQTDQRIPLIFYFPHGEVAGRIQNNVQNIDIAPTILDYLGLPIPKWMEGQSLIASEPDPNRRIYSTGVAYNIHNPEKGIDEIDYQRTQPPFYQFGFFQAVVCNGWYYIDLKNYEYRSGNVTGHTKSCDDEMMPDSTMILQELVDRLRSDGFDVSDFEKTVIEEIIPNQKR